MLLWSVRWGGSTCDTCVRFVALLPACDWAPGLYLVLSGLPEAPPRAVETEEMHVRSYKALLQHTVHVWTAQMTKLNL